MTRMMKMVPASRRVSDASLDPPVQLRAQPRDQRRPVRSLRGLHPSRPIRRIPEASRMLRQADAVILWD